MLSDWKVYEAEGKTVYMRDAPREKVLGSLMVVQGKVLAATTGNEEIKAFIEDNKLGEQWFSNNLPMLHYANAMEMIVAAEVVYEKGGV